MLKRNSIDSVVGQLMHSHPSKSRLISMWRKESLHTRTEKEALQLTTALCNELLVGLLSVLECGRLASYKTCVATTNFTEHTLISTLTVTVDFVVPITHEELSSVDSVARKLFSGLGQTYRTCLKNSRGSWYLTTAIFSGKLISDLRSGSL